MGIMEGRTSAEIKYKYIHLYAPALLANWTIWPFAQVSDTSPVATLTTRYS